MGTLEVGKKYWTRERGCSEWIEVEIVTIFKDSYKCRPLKLKSPRRQKATLLTIWRGQETYTTEEMSLRGLSMWLI